VLPILHLNGYKIANPAVLARIPRGELTQLMRGCGWEPYFVEGDVPARLHVQMAQTLDAVLKSNPRNSSGRAARRLADAARVANDRPGDAEGMDRSEGGRRASG